MQNLHSRGTSAMVSVCARFVQLLFLGLMFCFLAGCRDDSAVSTKGELIDSSKKIKVIATLFPQYDFARQVFKDKADVQLLLPPGVESHSYDPTPSNIASIYCSDLFIYTGKYMELWSEKIISGMKSKKTKVVDVSRGVDLIKGKKHDHGGEENHSSSHHHKYDPHIWLDPMIAIIMVDNILENACEISPENKDFFTKNANSLKEKLKALDKDFEDLTSSSENDKKKTVVFVGKFAHIYFMNRYKLNYKTMLDGCFAGAEPSGKKFTEITEIIKQNNIPAIYFEEPSIPSAAQSIAQQTGTKPLRFSACHNLTKDELESNVSYIDMMRLNYENLKEGLNP
ncbi:MAG: zinc ABC transporter substrate-binding protein [Oscillospiraceae bacterium]|jgi:zinc transport system substrate-binding protein|nr:zinc ABC transporter substrate-binding protein [Oscillospiraceae bacterium]